MHFPIRNLRPFPETGPSGALVAFFAVAAMMLGGMAIPAQAAPPPPVPPANHLSSPTPAAVWTNISLNSTGGPNGSIVFDNATQELVSSTMTYHNGQWSPNGGPGGNAIAYDPGLGSGSVVVVKSNATVWLYSAGAWAWRSTLGVGPANAGSVLLTYDSFDGYLVAVDPGDFNGSSCDYVSNNYFPCWGTFAVWNLSSNLSWSPIAPLPTEVFAIDPNGGGFSDFMSPGLVYDSHANSVIAVTSGGETYSYQAGSWTNLSRDIWTNYTSGNPGFVGGEGFVYDPQLGGSVLFGGSCTVMSDDKNDYYGAACETIGGPRAGYNTTWLFRGGNWTNITVPNDPTARADMSMAFDAANNFLVAFGGNFKGENATSCCDGTPVPNLSNDTWAFSNQPITPPSPVHGARLAGQPSPTDVGTPVRLVVRFDGGRSPFAYRWSNATTSWNSSINSTTISWGVPGTYKIGVRVSDSVGTYQSASANFTVHADPLVTIEYVRNQTVGLAEGFNATPLNGTGLFAYAWNFGDGTNSSSQNVTRAYATPGVFNLTLNATDSVGQPITVQGRVDVTSTIVAVLNVSNATPSLGQSIWFNVSTSGGVGPFTYQWIGLPIPCVSQNSPTIGCLPAESGNFSVAVRVTDSHPGGASASANVSVVFDFTIVISASSALLGKSIRIFVLSTTSGVSYSYSGLPPGCASKDTALLVCTPTQVGNFSVIVTATDIAGDSTSRTCYLEVLSPSAATSTSASPLSPIPWLWILGVALLAVVLGIVIGRIRKTGSRPVPRPPDPKYAGFRAPVRDDGPVATVPTPDPRDELF
jgi:hypothetical protein